MSVKKNKKSEKLLEMMLVLITIALGSLLYSIEQTQFVVLYLFFLPVVMAGFFLGRYRAGVLALLSVVTATLVITLDLDRFALGQSPAVVALSVMLWGAILGLTAIMVGTLNEELNNRVQEVHEAHVGVVEVLARCLQSADPQLQTRATRVDHLAEQVAMRMRLTPREIDEVRVAALLMDLANIEITARVIKRAVGTLESDAKPEESTFHGSELVNSLGTALSGAFPLVLMQSVAWEDGKSYENVPVGARILRIVRRFVDLTGSNLAAMKLPAAEALEDIRQELEESHDKAVVNVLEEVVRNNQKNQEAEVSQKAELATVS